MNNGINIKLKALYLIGDLISLNLAIAIASYIKFYNGIRFHAEHYPELFIIFNVLWILIMGFSKAYNSPRTVKFSTRTWRTIGLIGLHGMLISSFWVMAKAYYFSREFLLLTYLFFSIILLFWRIVVQYSLRVYRRIGHNFRSVIVYGYGDIAVELVQYLNDHPQYGYKFKGYFDKNESLTNTNGTFNDIEAFVENNSIDEIYCCLPYVDYKDVKSLVDFGDEALVKIKLLTDFRGFSSKSIALERYDHIPVLSVNSIPLDDWKNRFVKRSFDILISLIVLFGILSWLFPIIALLIKIDSKGPVLFKQKRTGQDKKDFYCFKFRTMTMNYDSESVQAKINDSRITGLGNFFRRTSIDELPQFFNVLKGEMSVIGPRPHMLKHTEEYSKKIEKFMARHFVKPGITGLAQAKGYRGPTAHLHQMSNRVKLDRFYVENWSLFLDLKILALTAASIIKGDENAF